MLVLWGWYGAFSNVPAEDQTEGEHQVGNVTSGLGAVHGGDDGDRKSRSEQEELLHVKPHEETSDVDRVGEHGVAVVADGVVPAEEEDSRDEDWTSALVSGWKAASDSPDQGISTTMLERMKTFHEYVLDGRSRISYRLRWVTKLGMIC